MLYGYRQFHSIHMIADAIYENMEEHVDTSNYELLDFDTDFDTDFRVWSIKSNTRFDTSNYELNTPFSGAPGSETKGVRNFWERA